MKVWSPAEVYTFLAGARNHRLFPAFALLVATGLTRGELVGLRWGDIDLDAGTINVRRIVTMISGTRTESEPAIAARRTVTIGAYTVELLRAHRAESGHPGVAVSVFEQRNGGDLNPESLSTTFARLVNHAGVSALTIGGLRHAHAAMAFKAGDNPLVVSKRLGHSTSATTNDMYGHLIPPLHDTNLDAFEAELFETRQ